MEIIRALALVKKAAANVNCEFGLDHKLADVICNVADEVTIKINFICFLVLNAQ